MALLLQEVDDVLKNIQDLSEKCDILYPLLLVLFNRADVAMTNNYAYISKKFQNLGYPLHVYLEGISNVFLNVYQFCELVCLPSKIIIFCIPGSIDLLFRCLLYFLS